MIPTIFKSFHKVRFRKQITVCLLGLSLLITSTALAAYKPSSTQRSAPPNTLSGAGTTRGCQGSGLPPTVLASHNYINQTASSHPTLAWFIPDKQPYKMKFSIYETDVNGKATKRLYQKILQSSPGIMTLSPFSPEERGLESGKLYIWQVVIYCDPAFPSSGLIDRAYIEVVPVSPDKRQQLKQITKSEEKANFYAQAGIWYDALSEALKLAPPAQLGDMGSQLVRDLVNAEKLVPQSELTDRAHQHLKQRQENLQQIALQAQ